MAIRISGKVKEKESFQRLYEAEKKFDFYNISYNKIPLWSFPREKASFFMNGFTTFSEPVSVFLRIRPVNLLKRIASFIFGLNKIFGNDIIVFVNERHLQQISKDNIFYNQYAEMALMGNQQKKAIIFEFPTAMLTKYKNVKYERYLPMDFIVGVKKAFSFLYLFFYPKIKKEFYLKIQKADLWQEEDVPKILKFIAIQAYNIKYYSFVLNIIRLLNPRAKFIYSCMAGYDKFPGVTEIQHGVIVDTHCHYIFPVLDSTREYIENKKTIVFSEKVKKLLVNNGYSDKNIEIRPNPKIYFQFLFNINDDFFKNQPESKEIVIIGDFAGNAQTTIKNAIFNIEKNKKEFDGWNISLVLHPSERNIYKDLQFSKVRVFENQEVSLWQMISRAVVVVSICSSVLEEAVYFGCYEIILINEAFEDQKFMIDWMCGDYPYKTDIFSDDFSRWFSKNKDKIINHWQKKREIMKENYEYFKNYKKQ